MPDAIFEHPRLVACYDAVEGARDDLEAYLAMVAEFGARRVLDVGCGTGTFALLLAGRGVQVIGLDPAAGALRVARAKPGAGSVRWVEGGVPALPPGPPVDLACLTGNVAQAIVAPDDWDTTLRGVHRALSPGGRLVFETRDPARRAWREWTRAESRSVTEVPGAGAVESWVELLDVAGPLVSFRWTYRFRSDGAVLTSDSTLRFRPRDEVEADLRRHGYLLDEVREAPDRPGREFVFVARRPAG